MGFGILFRVADESIPNHVDERKPKFLNQSEVNNRIVTKIKETIPLIEQFKMKY
jgi:hypothetical protein